MSTRRGFLRLLGVGAGAAVAAPVASKALDVLTQPGTDMYLNNRNYNPSAQGSYQRAVPTSLGSDFGSKEHSRVTDNPHAVTKAEMGLGAIGHAIDGVATRIG